ncbi:F-box/kelch-repeat protein At3g23880-like [Camellia sinensis]|uniref:F-box/kelch-repeat protein At3g23880-like n=1 Tax=Camellia sinensis TaxID=4442 RepID=UPI001035A210|nr:F-box/kelch-repeat protein At3g23880-like [Camellia sinensis]
MASRYLSEELVIEILSRLPVKSLMRFKCVCKTWCSLTTNPSLIAAHLNNNTDRTISWNGNTKGLIVGSDDFHVFPNCIRNLQPVNLKFGFKRKPGSVLGSIHGFGFDMKTGNFKVVKAVRFWDEGSIENGIIDEVVVSFDIGEEVLNVTVLPKDYPRVMAPTFGKFTCNLTLVKGSLAIICSFFEERHSRLEVWVMKNYEVDESWSLELSVGPDRGLHTSLGFWNDNELLILRNPGLLFLERDGSAFLHNPVTKQARDLCISGEPNFIYKESLVSVEGGNIGN